MKKILFLSKGEQSASTRYRASGYFPALVAAGWLPSHMGLHEGVLGKLQILRAAQTSDVVVLLRHGLSLPFLQLLRKCSRKLIFDFDDAVFLKSSGKLSSVRGQRFDRTVAKCDQIWAGNHYLAERALRVNPETIVLPTSIDMSRYLGEGGKPEDSFDLVWIGSDSTSKYLDSILPALENAAALEPRLRLKIIADFCRYSDNLRIVNVPWQQETEIPELQSSHVGIAPMCDDPWTRGKCGLKVLQYMASRLPVISSAVGANCEIIRHEKTGFLVSTEQEWIDAILTLASTPSLRKAMGDAGYQVCDTTYSLQTCAGEMLSQLETLGP